MINPPVARCAKGGLGGALSSVPLSSEGPDQDLRGDLVPALLHWPGRAQHEEGAEEEGPGGLLPETLEGEGVDVVFHLLTGESRAVADVLRLGIGESVESAAADEHAGHDGRHEQGAADDLLHGFIPPGLGCGRAVILPELIQQSTIVAYK